MGSTEKHTKVKILTIDEVYAGQRIDNFLFRYLKGIPKSRIYRSLRQGEVRVNKKRVKPDYRIKENDEIRLPPLKAGEEKPPTIPPPWQLRLIEQSIIFEDEGLVIINKPVGVAVHGGSGINFGVIETLRVLRPKAKFLELVHRLDRDTSGCLMIAKKRGVLTELHELLRAHQVEKVYLALVKGHWRQLQRVGVPLLKYELKSGERMVRVSDKGKTAITEFQPMKHFAGATLMKVVLHTGRTHQIRVHAAHVKHPIAGDEKYGDKEFNKKIRQQGLKRLFLHAASLCFRLSSGEVNVCANLDPNLIQCLLQLKKL